jgi:NADH-quinone oxidoreductase subunit F
MPLVHRVLTPDPIQTFDEYLARGGGTGWEKAMGMSPAAIVAEVAASGLRGRGGAGFPTGRKWQTILDNRSPDLATSVVINGAEGEPGTFKDRTIIRLIPYRVLEGALIASRAVGADSVFIGLKRSFGPEVARMRQAVEEVKAAGWFDGVDVVVFEGPNEYLYGEETALLETIDGRYPFPRVDPPFRRGVVEVVETPEEVVREDNVASQVELAGGTDAPPTLVDNIETIANVARIIERGAAWFRSEGTEQSPGTIVVTITGAARDGVGEVIMGTTLREAIEEIGGGVREGHQIKAVLPGVSAAIITEDQLDTPLTYEDMAAIGSGLGSAGYIVFDDEADMAAVAAGVSRFLAVESCGQCTPCKQDGLTLSRLLAQVATNDGDVYQLQEIRKRVNTVGDRARCYLATQHQVVLTSMLERFGHELDAHVEKNAKPVEPATIAELVDIEGDTARWDERHLQKQPDWTFDSTDSGKTPVERLL